MIWKRALRYAREAFRFLKRRLSGMARPHQLPLTVKLCSCKHCIADLMVSRWRPARPVSKSGAGKIRQVTEICECNDRVSRN